MFHSAVCYTGSMDSQAFPRRGAMYDVGQEVRGRSCTCCTLLISSVAVKYHLACPDIQLCLVSLSHPHMFNRLLITFDLLLCLLELCICSVAASCRLFTLAIFCLPVILTVREMSKSTDVFSMVRGKFCLIHCRLAWQPEGHRLLLFTIIH